VSERRIPSDSGPSRTELKRQAIVEAATRLFLQQGYDGTSMDDIASAAEVSKQTVYKQFTDKQQLFTHMVLGVAEMAESIVGTILERFDGISDVESGLADLARFYATAVLAPPVLQLRRLVISEADRFPDLAEAYFEQAPSRGLEAVAEGLRRLDDRGLLRVEDSSTAATHFAYLVLGPLIDRALFHPHHHTTAAEIAQVSEAGVKVFIAAYA
jgi:TetR/AcrR family transcriptional repressor of mexJK operon